jgi:diguanylate cyclase (GGDEF)-like protein/PAS domain S-box-containing protein
VTADLSHILEAYRALFHGHPDAVHLIDPAGDYVEVNERACEIKGLPRERVIGHHYSEFVAPEDRERLAAIFDAALRGHPQRLEHSWLDEAGERHYFAVSAMPLLVDGEVQGVYAISQDLTEHQRARQALEENQLMLRAASRTARLGGWVVDLDEQRVCWSEEVRAIHEVPPGTASYSVEEAISFYAPESIDRVRAVYQACATEGTPFDEELEIITAAGRRLWVRSIGEAVRDDSGRITHVRGAFQDISDKKLAEAAIRQLEERLSVAMEAMTDAFLTIDRDYRYTYLNREAERLLGKSRDEIMGRTVWNVFPELVGTVTEESFREAMVEQHSLKYELYYDPYGIWVEIGVYPWPKGLAVLFHDISERKRTEEEIQFLAFYDPLTGLPNRRLLMDRLQQAVAASLRHGMRGAVLFLDLDHFKTLNDTLGHTEGDALLRRVAERLTACVRATDTVARFGGDEYVIVLGDLASDPDEAMRQAEITAKKILATLTQPSQFPGRERQGTCSIGITLFGQPGDTVDEIMKQADLAMYQAKASGRNTHRRFDPAMQAAMTLRVRTEAEVRRGLERLEFEPFYQPQVDLQGSLSGAEALARWRHPERGVVPPMEFIPLAEETGLIFGLGKLMLEHVCRDMTQWAVRPKHPSFCVAVNVSARQFHHPDFVQEVVSVIEKTGADPRQLQLELTESSLLMDMDDTISKMKALKSLGVSFSLDDFGTGYSSLYYLKHLPLDQIKIDQRFVRGVLDDANDAAIVRAIIALAGSLGLNVIAEGVEDTRVQAFLADEGCSMFQGYLYSQPVAKDRFERFFLAGQIVSDGDAGRMA